MDYTIKTVDPLAEPVACAIVGVFQDDPLPTTTQRLNDATEGLLERLLQEGDLSGELGETVMLHRPTGTMCERVLLVGCGESDKFSAGAFIKATQATGRALQKSGTTEAVSFLTELPLNQDTAWAVRQTVMILEDILYTFDEFKGKGQSSDTVRDTARDTVRQRPAERPSQAADPKRNRMSRLVIHTEALAGRTSKTDPLNEAIRQGQAIAAGMRLTKDLGNLPPNVCTPSYLAERAQALAKQHALKVTVLDEADMEKAGMGALLSVTRGSEQPGKLITLSYTGGAPGAKPIVLVGKGITFDSGGISIKPSPNMDEMKYDMCGAATVLGTLLACAQMKLPLNLVGILAAAENMPSGRASRPGDIVRTLSGQTVEILNTDAEGRLVLCDALTYADRFEPAAVIDIATLTGACIVALGHVACGLLGNDEVLIQDLLKASETIQDRAWQLPLWEDYQEQIKSPFADMANIGTRGAGTIIGAAFLARFTQTYRWAHLDIAGVAWQSGDKKTATGRPVPLLTQYLLDQVARRD